MLAGSLLSAWEFWLLVAVMLIALALRHPLGPGRNAAGTNVNQDEHRQPWLRFEEAVTVWLAQGFGSGRAPVAPGTFGSLVGLLWLMALAKTGSFWGYLAGTLWGLALSVIVCGTAERILKQHDPPSVVLDEITAIPLCFLPWVGWAWFHDHVMPSPLSFFHAINWVFTLILFVLFRFFDIAKPWPVRQSQRLPGGWGVTADDVLAAIYVALVSLLIVGRVNVRP